LDSKAPMRKESQLQVGNSFKVARLKKLLLTKRPSFLQLKYYFMILQGFQIITDARAQIRTGNSKKEFQKLRKKYEKLSQKMSFGNTVATLPPFHLEGHVFFEWPFYNVSMKSPHTDQSV